MSNSIAKPGVGGGAAADPLPDLLPGEYLSGPGLFDAGSSAAPPELQTHVGFALNQKLAQRVILQVSDPGVPLRPMELGQLGSLWVNFLVLFGGAAGAIQIDSFPRTEPRSGTGQGFTGISASSPIIYFTNRSPFGGTVEFLNERFATSGGGTGATGKLNVKLLLPGRKDYLCLPGESCTFVLLGGTDWLMINDVRSRDILRTQTIALTAGGGAGTSGEYIASDFDGVTADVIDKFASLVFIDTAGAVQVSGLPQGDVAGVVAGAARQNAGRRISFALLDTAAGSVEFLNQNAQEPTAVQRIAGAQTLSAPGDVVEYQNIADRWRKTR